MTCQWKILLRVPIPRSIICRAWPINLARQQGDMLSPHIYIFVVCIDCPSVSLHSFSPSLYNMKYGPRRIWCQYATRTLSILHPSGTASKMFKNGDWTNLYFSHSDAFFPRVKDDGTCGKPGYPEPLKYEYRLSRVSWRKSHGCEITSSDWQTAWTPYIHICIYPAIEAYIGTLKISPFTYVGITSLP